MPNIDCMKAASKVRYLCSELVRIEWQENEGAASATAILEEIWPEGACVQTLQPMRAGTRIWIVGRQALFLGTLMECQFQTDGYYSQVLFDEDSRWSSRRYKPEHMVSSQAVLARWLRQNLTEAPKTMTAGSG